MDSFIIELLTSPNKCLTYLSNLTNLSEYIPSIPDIINSSNNLTENISNTFSNIFQNNNLENFIFVNEPLLLIVLFVLIYIIGIIIGILIYDLKNEFNESKKIEIYNKNILENYGLGFSHKLYYNSLKEITDNYYKIYKKINNEIPNTPTTPNTLATPTTPNTLATPETPETLETPETPETTTSNNYYVLYRVKMANKLTMKCTSNIKHKTFDTNDMYMIMAFTIKNSNNENININISNIILDFLNYYKLSTYTTNYDVNDFIVIAISKENKMLSMNKEFYNSIKNLDYESTHLKCIKINLPNGNYCNIKFTIPTLEMYNLFMDVYNDTIFESKFYEINKDNCDFWNLVSLNKAE